MQLSSSQFVAQEVPEAEMTTGIIDLDERYDQFQSEAVQNIVSDYTENAAGRYLLVIPTGGGKTYTAVKAINPHFPDELVNRCPEMEIML